MKAALAIVLVTYGAVCAVMFHDDFPHRNLIFVGAATVIAALAIVLLARTTLAPGTAAVVVVSAGALLQLIALTRSPLTSDDAFRYVWDGKVQLAGIDPYRFAPSAPQLAHLRDAHLFGPSSRCTYPIHDGCTAINRPDVRTIYPPVAQAAFVLARLVALGGHGGVLVFQLLAAFGAVAISVVLAQRALRRNQPVWPVALWAWSPVVVSELGQNGHIDWLAALLTVAALQAGARRRTGWAGVLAGAAVATKLYPALALPALLRRRPLAVIGASIAVVVLGYLAHVVAVGHDVLGYLPGYFSEEGYDSGARLLLLSPVLPHPSDTVVGALVLAALALWAWRRSDPTAPEHAATVLIGGAFLVTTPGYGWYAVLLIALAVLSGRYEWVVVALAPSVVYLVRADLTHWSVIGSAIYGVAGAGTALWWYLRTTRPHLGATPDLTETSSAACYS